MNITRQKVNTVNEDTIFHIPEIEKQTKKIKLLPHHQEVKKKQLQFKKIKFSVQD